MRKFFNSLVLIALCLLMGEAVVALMIMTAYLFSVTGVGNDLFMASMAALIVVLVLLLVGSVLIELVLKRDWIRDFAARIENIRGEGLAIVGMVPLVPFRLALQLVKRFFRPRQTDERVLPFAALGRS